MSDCGAHCHDGCEGCGHDHGHGHAHHHHEPQTVRLELSDGTSKDFLIAAAFEVDGRNYFALMEEGQDSVMLCRYTEAENGVEISTIEEDAEYDEAAGAFYALYGDEN